MLIVALALAVIGLAALVTAVVTSNEIVAWVCIGASALGVILLVVDAVRERQAKRADSLTAAGAGAAETTAVIDGVGDTEIIETVETIETDETDVEPDAERDVELDADTELEAEIAVEDHPEEVVHDEPEYDTYSDDEPDYPPSAEESALHTVIDDETAEVEVVDGEAAESDER